VGILVTGSSGSGSPHQTSHKSAVAHLGDGAAKRSVLAALSATTDSGNFSFNYELNEAPGTATSTPTTCPPLWDPRSTENPSAQFG